MRSLLYFFFLSCQKESSRLNNLTQNNISAAKGFVETSIAITSKASFLSSIIPNWNKAIHQEDNGKTIYEVECENSNHLINAPKSSTTSKEIIETQSAIKLILIEDKDHNFKAYFMFVSGQNANLSTNHYKSLPNFTGTVMFYTIEGAFSNGYEYDNGQIKKTINLASKSIKENLQLNIDLANSGNT